MARESVAVPRKRVPLELRSNVGIVLEWVNCLGVCGCICSAFRCVVWRCRTRSCVAPVNCLQSPYLIDDPGRAEGGRLQTSHTRSAPQHHIGDAANVGAGDYPIFSSHRERRPSFSETAGGRSPRQIARGRGPSSREANFSRNTAPTVRVGEFAGSVEVRRPSLEGSSESRATFDTTAPDQRTPLSRESNKRTPLSRESNSSRTSYAGHRHRRPSFTGDDKPPRKSPRDLRSVHGRSDDSRPPLRIARERRTSFRDRNFSAASAVEFAGSRLDAGQSQPYASTTPRDQNRIFSRDGWRPAFATVLQRRPSSDETRNRRSSHVTPRERQFSLDEARNHRSPHVTSHERQYSLDETRNRRSPHVTPRERQFSFDEARNRRSPHVTSREQQVSLDETRNRRSPHVTPRCAHVTSREQQSSLDETSNRRSPRVTTLLVDRQDEKP